ncbi:MAG: CsgG/HfaB family protein, partial [Gemmatimonadales bacterium]
MSNSIAGASRSRLLVPRVAIASWALLVVGCAGGRPAEVSPEEIPALEQQLATDPNNGDVLLRYSAALFTSGQCDSAIVVARRGMRLKPTDALGPLVIGSCSEEQRLWDQAVDVYHTYLVTYPEARGSGAVRAREIIAQRERAADRARLALQQEADLAQQPGDPQTLAVLPIDVVGDSSYQPLSRGLAQIITSDLALLQRFRMVERLQVGALLDEMELGQSGRVDPTT